MNAGYSAGGNAGGYSAGGNAGYGASNVRSERTEVRDIDTIDREYNRDGSRRHDDPFI